MPCFLWVQGMLGILAQVLVASPLLSQFLHPSYLTTQDLWAWSSSCTWNLSRSDRHFSHQMVTVLFFPDYTNSHFLEDETGGSEFKARLSYPQSHLIGLCIALAPFSLLTARQSG